MKRVAVFGAFLITVVVGAGDAGAGSASQVAPPRSAVSTHAGVRVTILIDPLRVGLRLKPPTVRAGMAVEATESIGNLGKLRLSNIIATIEPLVDLVVKPGGSQTVRSLPAMAVTSVRWSLCATRAGTYAIVAQTAAQDAAGRRFVAYSPPESLVVTGSGGKCG